MVGQNLLMIEQKKKPKIKSNLNGPGQEHL